MIYKFYLIPAAFELSKKITMRNRVKPTAKYNMFLEVPNPTGNGPINPTKPASVFPFPDCNPEIIINKIPAIIKIIPKFARFIFRTFSAFSGNP